LETLKQGGLPPWRSPWKPNKNSGFPMNAKGRKYRGVNILLLQAAAMRHGFTSKWWATYRQWQEMGGQVMRRPNDVPSGCWGTTIIFWKPITVADESEETEEKEKQIFLMRTYTVFNIDQVENGTKNLDHLRAEHSDGDEENPIVTYEKADDVIESTNADIRHGGNRAFYRRDKDYIQLPLKEQFTGPEYYETIFHELGHWSEKRLDWTGSYAMGELIAEMSSCFLATELGLPNAENLPNHASYLKSWLREMENDHQFVIRASSQASKVVDFLTSFSHSEQPEPEVVAAVPA